MQTHIQKQEQIRVDLFNLVFAELSDKLLSLRIIKKANTIIVKSSPSVMIRIGSWINNQILDLSKISIMYGGFWLTEKMVDIANPNFINEIIKFINNAPRWKSEQKRKNKNVK